jgi:hypothetical protein
MSDLASVQTEQPRNGKRRAVATNRLAGLVPPATRTKIAIVGFTEHRQQAPYANPDWEIWGLNDLYLDLPPVTPRDRLKWFQVHELSATVSTIFGSEKAPPAPRDPGHMLRLQEISKEIPVYTLRPQPELPHAQVLPREALESYFAKHWYGDRFTYFTNSIAWMLGMAIMQLCPEPDSHAPAGAEIAVYGVDMMVAGGQGSEYGWQRPSCEFFLGYAAGHGIKVTLPPESDLVKTAFPYGDAIGNEWRKKLQSYRTEMSRRRGMLTDQRDQALYGIAELTGAINAADHWLLAWMPGDSGDPSIGRVPVPDSHKAPPAPPAVPDYDHGA